MNYLSLWTANLGVVPWFSFLFFLFLPIFLAFRALLVFVCCVLEAIFIPFVKLISKLIASSMGLRRRFLSSRAAIVKIFLASCAVFVFQVNAKELKTKEFFLAKGEQVEMEVKSLESFSVGNKEVIKSKYYAAKQQLLIKGSSLGFSDVVVWNKSGVKTTYHFYVVSKREQLASFQLANDFKSLGLEVKALAFQLLVRGELKTLEQLKLFKMYMKENSEKVASMVTLSKELKNTIIANIYLDLGGEVQALVCNCAGVQIECLYEGLDTNSLKAKRAVALYGVKFSPRSRRYAQSNFRVRLKVFRTDQSHLDKAGLGLDRLSSKVGRFLNHGAEALLDSNTVFLGSKELESRIVTSPEILTSPGSSAQVQLGAEIPVPNQNQYGASYTTWKFAGLKMQASLSLEQTRLKLALESELTHPAQDLIRGSKSKNEFFVRTGKYAQAFKIKYEVHSSGKSALPALGDIPVLGALFSSADSNSSEQWLIGYVKVVRAEDEN